MSYSSGRAEAMKKETFLIADENSPLLILRIYGDNLIGVPFRSKEKRLSSEFLVVKISDMKTSLQLRKVGRLIPQGDLSY